MPHGVAAGRVSSRMKSFEGKLKPQYSGGE